MANKEWAWRAEITQLITEIKTNQDNMHEKLDNYIEASQTRFDRMEKTVFGLNGQPGLAEKVRTLKGKWATLIGLVSIVSAVFINAMIRSYFPRP